MYQGIYFDRNNKEYFLRDDTRGITNFTYYNQKYKLDEEGEYTTLFGDRCSPISGKFDWNDPKILEKDIDKELAVLRDFYYQSEEVPEYHNILYFDIEIEILGALTPITIREAKAKITSIAAIDDSTGERIVLMLDESKRLHDLTLDNTKVIPCKNEVELLSKWLNYWENIDPTIVVGYNSDFFDIPYIYFRIKKLLGDEVYRLSPIGKIEDNPYNSQSPIKIGLVASLDFMLLFKKYIMKEESSYKLGDIGLKYANLGKIEYNGSLDKLFEEDPKKFIEYNIRDVEIIIELEKKLKFIELTILISHLCHTPYEMVYYNTVLNDGAILTYLKQNNIVAPNKPTTTNPTLRELFVGDFVQHQRGQPTIEGIIVQIEGNNVLVQTKSGRVVQRHIRTIRIKDGYAGGFLLDPNPGTYDWLSDADYASLYPSIIRSLNLGIETFVCRVVAENQNYQLWNSFQELKERNPNDEIEVERLNKHTYKLESTTVKAGKLVKLIEKNNWNMSPNGAIFLTSKKSVAALILGYWFNKRVDFKKLMKKAYKDGDTALYDYYDRRQHAFKILLNALYGGYAITSWRFTDGHKICSSAITTCGQRMVSETIKYADEMIKKDYINEI